MMKHFRWLALALAALTFASVAPRPQAQIIQFSGAAVSAVDTTPNAFSFPDVTAAVPSTVYVSAAQTITGINSPTAISVSGAGCFSVNSGSCTTTSTTLNNNAVVQLTVTASASTNTAVNTVLTIGGVSDTWTVTTSATPDTTPDPFTFADTTGAELSTLTTSNTLTLSGTDTDSAISISGSGATFSVNGGAFSATTRTISPGQTFAVRTTTSASYSTAASATLTIGGVADTWSVTTKSDPGSSLGVAYDFAGPYLTKAAGTATTTNFATWEGFWTTYQPQHWTNYTTGAGARNEISGNFGGAVYDRSLQYMIQAERDTANASTYTTRATTLLQDYVSTTVGGVAAPEQYQQLKGAAVAIKKGIDSTNQKDYLGRMADRACYFRNTLLLTGWHSNSIADTNGVRFTGHYLEALIGAAWSATPDVPYNSSFPGCDTTFALAATDVVTNNVLLAQETAGHAEYGVWRTYRAAGYVENVPFQNALMDEALRLYDRNVSNASHAAIVAIVIKNLNWMEAVMLDPSNDGYYYEGTPPDSVKCCTASPDLEGWFSSLHYWMYNETGDTTWRDRGDRRLARQVNGTASINGSANQVYYKQFSEMFMPAFPGSYYRSATPLTSPTVPVCGPPTVQATGSGNMNVVASITCTNTPTSRAYDVFAYHPGNDGSPPGVYLGTTTTAGSQAIPTGAAFSGFKIYVMERATNASGTSVPMRSALSTGNAS